MKRWNLWYLISGILQLSCVIHILIDWLRYCDSLNSAPFSLIVWVNVLCFGVPAAVGFLIGLYWEKRRKDDSHENSH